MMPDFNYWTSGEAMSEFMIAHGGGYKTKSVLTGTIHHEAVYEDVWIDEVWHWENHDGYWE